MSNEIQVTETFGTSQKKPTESTLPLKVENTKVELPRVYNLFTTHKKISMLKLLFNLVIFYGL